MNVSTLDELSYTLELSDTLVELSYTLQWCFHLSCRGSFEDFFSPFFLLLFFVFCIETVFWIEASVAVIAPPIPSPSPLLVKACQHVSLHIFVHFPESEVESACDVLSK